METPRESALIRLRPELMALTKRRAKAMNMSFNAFVEKTLERAVRPEWPVLPKDYKISEEVLKMNCRVKMPSAKEIAADPRLQHILACYED